MKTAIKRTLLMLLMVMMVVALVPNAGVVSKAYAEDIDSPAPGVTVGWIDENGYQNTVWLDSSRPYYVNGAKEATSDSSVDWNAYYNTATGDLTFNNYYGAGVDIRSQRGYVAIILNGENYIGGKGQFGIYVQDNIYITSESWGTLEVDTGTDYTSYGLCSNYGSIIIYDTADVSVKVTAEGGAYAVKAENGVMITGNASLKTEAYSEGSGAAYGIMGNTALIISTPYEVTYKGEGAAPYGSALSGFDSIDMYDGTRMSMETNGNSEDCIFDPISKLRSMLKGSDHRVRVYEEGGIYHGFIEPKTNVPSTIYIDYDKNILSGLNMFMTGEEAYAQYLEALWAPTSENYDGNGGWYVDLDGWSGISADTGDGPDLNYSTELFEYGEPYYIMFDIALDEDNYYSNPDQLFEVNYSEDYFESEYTDSDGYSHYLISIELIAGYGPPKSVYICAYNKTTYYNDDKVSFNGVDYDSNYYYTAGQGEQITLYAKAGEGDEFLEWRKDNRVDGEIISTEPVTTVTVMDDESYFAVFQKKIPAAGTLCDTVDYTFDEATGTVTLIPTGTDEDGNTYGIARVDGWQMSPFYKNNKVKNVVVLEGITHMEYAVFEENTLETVSFPASLQDINWRTFEDTCIEGDGFTVDPANEYLKAVDGSLFSKDGETMIKFVKKPGQTEYTIPDGVEEIGSKCFEHTSLDKVTLRGEGLYLYDYAFDYCTLGQVIIEEGVEYISYQRSTILADSITFPASVIWINTGGFIDCSDLKNIYVDAANPFYESIGGVLFYHEYASDDPASEEIDFSLFKYPNGRTVSTYTVPDGVTAINGQSMQNEKLTEIIVPESVAKIKYYAFAFRYDSPITVQIDNPECVIDSNVFESCNDVTIKAPVGSTAQVLAEDKGYTFIPVGENHGKLPAPTNLRWDGTTARWNAIPGVTDVRYNIKFYEINSDGTLYHVDSLDQIITDGSTEWADFRQRMLYQDVEYCFTISASKAGYETSDVVQSPSANGVLERKTALPSVVRDSLIFPTDISREIEGVNYFYGNLTVWNSSDEKVYDRAYMSSDSPSFNLRERFYYDSLPYGTYKIQASMAVQFYNWGVWIIDEPEDQYVYYDYQPVPEITRVEVTVPEMVTGMRSYDPPGLELKAYGGDQLMDGVFPDSSTYWNNWEYAEKEGSYFTYFSDGRIHKGKYQYAYRLGIDKYEGYTYAENVEVYVNGSKENVTITSQDDYSVNIRYYYPVGTQPKTGWVNYEGDWYYYNDDGDMVTNKWQKDGSKWCYLGADGKRVSNAWRKDSKGWCYLGSDGYMVTNDWAPDSHGNCWIGSDGYMVEKTQWIKVGSDWYYINKGYRVENSWRKDSKGWCYLGEDGRMVTNGWAKDSKGYCWMGSDGYMVEKTQWFKIESDWYHITKGYRDQSKWMKDSKGWCYLDGEGKMVTNGWAKDSKGWCWIGAEGYMVEKTKWFQIGDDWYHITNGYRDQSKWMKDSHGWCYLDAEGKMVTNGFAPDSHGQCWIGEDGYMVEETRLVDYEGDVYYIIDGYMQTNCTVEIGGSIYEFGPDGKLLP